MLQWNVDVKKYGLVSLFDKFLNPYFKMTMTASFVNVARTTASIIESYTMKNFKS